MSANPIPAPNNDLALQPIAVPVGEIEAVCAKHSVPSGNPDSLDHFLRALHTDKHLAMNFWALVARLTDQHPSADSGPLLAAIVLGVTGNSLEEIRASGPESQRLLRDLTGLLAGEDALTPLPPRPVQSVRPAHLGSQLRREVDARHALPLPQLTPAGTDDTGSPRVIPRTETPFAAAMARSLRERESVLNPQEPKPPIVIPLASYAEAGEYSTSVSPKLAGGILLALAAGAIVLLYHGNWKRLNAAIHAQYVNARTSKNHAGARNAASTIRDQSNVALAPKLIAAGPQPAGAPPNPLQPIAPWKATPSAASAALPLRDTAIHEPHADAQITVPEAVMKQNLFSSRVPILPAGATGTVVIQAIVTARGRVEPLRAISGDPALVRAAMAAAATWRYRPYMQDGTPVNVSTTISVDANGSD